MAKRKAVSTRTRFEIFKRDGFRCGYCRRSVSESPLHVDHIKPVVDGGTNEPENLITACEDCNSGKSSIPLEVSRYKVGDPARAKEHAEQLRAYMEAQKEVADAKRQATEQLVNLWCETLGVDTFHKNLRTLLPKAVDEFGMASVCDFIAIVAGSRASWAYRQNAWEIDCKYFCGITRKRRDAGWK